MTDPFHALVRETFGHDLTSAIPGGDQDIFQDAVSITGPIHSILETGFFWGGSALMLLHLCPGAILTSIDPMHGVDNRIGNATVLNELFPGRFTLIQESSSAPTVRTQLYGRSFDLFNVDGDHGVGAVSNDLSLASELGIPWVILDDFVTTVRAAYDAGGFSRYYRPIKVYTRSDHFQDGSPIYRVLLRSTDPRLGACGLPTCLLP